MSGRLIVPRHRYPLKAHDFVVGLQLALEAVRLFHYKALMAVFFFDN